MAANPTNIPHRPHALSALAAVAMVAILLAGCSVEKNYKILSVFFDGVPDPNAPVRLVSVSSTNGSLSGNESAPALLHQHKPYAEGRCTDCHTADKKQLITLKSELCVKCHEPETHQYSKMHTVVAAGQCLWCHEPHESDQPKLLKSIGPELCMQCHERELLPSDDRHQSELYNCLNCHVGHGSAKPSLLRSDNPTMALLVPATQPAPEGGGGGAQ